MRRMPADRARLHGPVYSAFMSASSSPREHLAAFASLTPRVTRAAWMGGIVLAIGLVGTAIWALSTARLYRSEAVVLYERGMQGAAVGGGAEGEGPRQVGLRLNDMINARQRLEGLIKEMKLYQPIIESKGMVDAIEEMRKHLIVGVKEGFTFKVSFDAEAREQAKSVLERLLKGIIDDDARRRAREAADAKAFLDTERKSADEDLRTKEAALASFLAQHPQLAAESAANAAAAGGLIRAADRDRVAPNGGEVASLEMQSAQLEEALAAAGRGARPVPGEAPIDPNLVASRARALAEVQAAQKDLADKQARFTNEHPDVKAAIRRVSYAESQLARAEAVSSAPRPMPVAGMPEPAPEDDGGARIAALRRALAAVKGQIGAVRGRAAPRAELPREAHSMVAIDTQWTGLMRATNEARERQNQIEAKQFQADLLSTLVSGGQAGRLIIADPPFRPNRPIFKIALVGGIASLALGILSVLLMAAFDDRLYGARDVERLMSTAIVVAVPRTRGKSG
jgi:protein tyrosine kinase modulator